MVENNIYSRYEYGNFRYPAGAVSTDSTVHFNIQIPRHYGLKEVNLVCINDNNHQYQYVKMNWKGLKEGQDIFETKVKVNESGIVWYYFQLKTLADTWYVGKGAAGIIESNSEPPSWQLSIYDQNFTTPDWIKGGLFYHIFVDRFAKEGSNTVKKHAVLRNDWGGLPVFMPNEFGEVMNNDFFGGNLNGITSKLDYLQSLGVTCLYLSPIFEAFSNHKYDTGDYTKIDPMFGTIGHFHTLCREAEKRGIRVILDGVFNHTGSDSVYFNKKGTYESIGAYQSKNSPFYNWYTFMDYPDEYESWWGISTLPAVNEAEASYVEFITGKDGIGERWLKEGAAGWRLDVVDELPDHFLEKLRSVVKNYNQDALIIGEVWEDASNKVAYGKRRRYFQGQQLDSVMNYPFMNAIIQFIRYRDAKNLHDVVTSIVLNYPSCVVHCLMNMLSTHDTRRVLTAIGGEELFNASKEEKSRTQMTVKQREEAINLMKLAVVLQMTLPGVPCIFYGDEAGMEGYEDPLNRRCYPWGKEEAELLKWYKKLGAIRKNHHVFKDGEYKTLYGDDHVFLFQRYNEKDRVIVGVNRSDQPFSLEVERLYEDVLNNEAVRNEYIIKPNECCLLVGKN